MAKETIRRRVLLVAGILAVAVLVLFLLQNNTEPAKHDTPSPIATGTPALDKMPPQIPVQINPPAKQQSFAKRAADMSEDERAKLAQDFKEKYKPTVENWFKAYEGRIPFAQEEFTLDSFHSRLGDYMYTFMIGDTTFTIQDSRKLGLKVSYLMTRRAAKELNQMPGKGFVPDLSVPVSREEIIRMVKTDTGIEFKLNEVIVKPTAAACAFNGGAFVDILPSGADPENGLNNKISMVFGADGKLVNYTRDPFF